MGLPTLSAAPRYGEVLIQKGNAIVVRQGRILRFSASKNRVPIQQRDVIRTLKNSSAILFTENKNRITLGANAIIQVKKWTNKSKSGKLRMLFGKFRARATKLFNRQPMQIRTATAIIGVKGSLAEGVTNSNFTSVANLGGDIDMGGIDIPLGQQGFKIDNGQNQGLDGTSQNPNFNPNTSEEEQETGDTEELDTTDTKEVETSPEIENAIVNEVEEVEETEGTTTPETNNITVEEEEELEQQEENNLSEPSNEESQEPQEPQEPQEEPEEAGFDSEETEGILNEIGDLIDDAEDSATQGSGAGQINIEVEN